MCSPIPEVVMFGGSFDPPHKGHVAIVDYLCRTSSVKKVFVIPTFLSPFKTKSLFSAEQRLEWSRIVFDNPKVCISDFEIMQNAPTPTLLTLQHLQHDTNQKYGIVIGADHLLSLDKWFNFETLAQMAIFVIFARPNYPHHAAILDKINFCWIDFECHIHSTSIRSNLLESNPHALDSIDSRIAKHVWENRLNKPLQL